MALRGTVIDYGLADVLQLISQRSRSGRLRLEQGSELLDLHLAHGTIVDVRTDRSHDGAVGSRLVQAGLLSEDRLGRALAERAHTGRSIGHILVDGGWVELSAIRQQATLHRWDTLMAPFTWTSGSYALEDFEITSTDAWAEQIPVEQMLPKGLRILQEWPSARAKIPSRRWLVDRRVPLPPPPNAADPFGEAFGAVTVQDVVSEEARWVHRLASPGTVVGAVIGRSPYDRYETTLALTELLDKRFVVVTPP